LQCSQLNGATGGFTAALGVREGKGPIGWFLDIAESEFPDTAAKA